DTVLFHRREANGHLLKALQIAAVANGGRLRVVDFGGALGSTWWQHRPWLEEFSEVTWSVVEQPAFVEIGQREFSVGPLRFFPSLSSCFDYDQPDIILLSSVLPYLEKPHSLLAEIRLLPFQHVI